jgi:AraC-like DNA-binding protein
MQVWELGPGRLMVAGGFSDLALHHHAAVQVTVGRHGPLTLTCDGDTHDTCRMAVITSGARHAVRSDPGAGALTLYLGLQSSQGAALSALCRNHAQRQGIWIVDDGQALAEATAVSLAAHGPRVAADLLVDALCDMDDRHRQRPVHPQLRQALQVVSSRVPDNVDVTSVAGAVALSPDYLGRLCKQQAGISMSATIRWQRLVAAVNSLSAGYSVTDAAHLAGFADGSHANKVCREMTGATPRELAEAVRQNLDLTP